MIGYPHVDRFESATILLPVMNETTSLQETVNVVLRDARDHIKEILMVVCPQTTPEAMAAIDRIQRDLRDLVVVVHQRLPFLGGALREGFDRARGSHVVMMASDLETDPGDVQRLIAEARKNPAGIVTASRWRGGGCYGYSRIKRVCNRVFRHFLSFLYGTRLSDMTYGYRILPAELARAIQWEETRHPFNLESIVKPLRLGVPIVEIPSVWHARVEGKSHNPFFRNFEYFRVALKSRFMRPEAMLKPLAPAPARSANPSGLP